MKILFYFLIIVSLSRCSTTYYVFNVDTPVDVYPSQALNTKLWVIPKGEQIIATKAKGRYRKVDYYYESRLRSGYIIAKTFPYENLVSASFYKNFVSAPPDMASSSTPTSSGRRTSSSTLKPTNSSGTVNVKGYYRKDGTYVRPYTRSAPRRK